MIFGLFGGKPNIFVIAGTVIDITNRKIREIREHKSQFVIDFFVVPNIFRCVGLLPLLRKTGREKLLNWLEENFINAGVPELVTMTLEDIYGTSDLKRIFELGARAQEAQNLTWAAVEEVMKDQERGIANKLPKAYEYVESKAPYNLDSKPVRNLLLCSACIQFLSQKGIEDLDYFEKVLFIVKE